MEQKNRIHYSFISTDFWRFNANGCVSMCVSQLKVAYVNANVNINLNLCLDIVYMQKEKSSGK